MFINLKMESGSIVWPFHCKPLSCVAGKEAQWVACSCASTRLWVLTLSTHTKNNMWWPARTVQCWVGRDRQTDLWGPLGSQPSWVGEMAGKKWEDSASKKTWWEMTEEDTRGLLLPFTSMHTLIDTCTRLGSSHWDRNFTWHSAALVCCSLTHHRP